MPVGVFGETDRARLGDSFKSRGDIDAIAHQIAVALLDDIAQMNADTKDDAALRRNGRKTLGHGVLHRDGAAHRVYDTAELHERAVAGALEHSPVMCRDRRVDEVAPQRP